MRNFSLPNSDFNLFKAGQPVRVQTIYLERYLHDLLKDNSVMISNKDDESLSALNGIALGDVKFDGINGQKDFFSFYVKISPDQQIS